MAKSKKRDELKIVGNGAAERARKTIKKTREKRESALDKIMKAGRTSLGIKKKQ